MKKYTLTGKLRTVLGRKVKNLRNEGLLPATVYGKKVKSESLTVGASDFDAVYSAAGETGLVELTLDGTTKPVLIHSVQKHPVKGTTLHVEFHQVDLKEKVKAQVPVELTGESPAVSQKLGVLLTLLTDVEVEALPTDLPEKIEVDVSSLSEVDQELKVSDLRAPAGVTILSDVTVSVAKIGALVSKEAEEQAAEEAAAATEAAAPEGEASTESSGAPAEPAGEQKTENTKSEEK